MWDFSLSQAISAIFKTIPFVLLRVGVYSGFALACIAATGGGATMGHMLMHSEEGQWFGGLAGFGLVCIVLYWMRDYLLYMVKAGHIVIMVRIIDGKQLPEGQEQINYARKLVKKRFREMSVLFAIDQLIKGVLGASSRIIVNVGNWLPVPGMGMVFGMIGQILGQILGLSLTYVDEVIIAYNIRSKSENPWRSSKEGLILYAQNYRTMLKNALFLAIFMYGLTILIFALSLAPIISLMVLVPGHNQAYVAGVIVAMVFAWSIKNVVLEPIAIFALCQAFFKVIEGQEPNPEWNEKLTSFSDKFRHLGSQADNFGWPTRAR